MLAEPRPQTLFDKIWTRHAIHQHPGGATLLHVGRHLIHDGSHNAFRLLKAKGLPVRRPDRTFATPDHYVPTLTRDHASVDPGKAALIRSLGENTGRAGVTIFDFDDVRQGIIHVVGPEQGLTHPGLLIVCGDSHTASHGALGALAFGIGASEVAHVLAVQAIWQLKPKSMRVTVEGTLGPWITAKDVALALVAQIGTSGGSGHVIEYAGPVIRALSVEGRLTLCNMAIESGAKAGMVAPDDLTFEYLANKPYAPRGRAWDRAHAYWRGLPSDEAAPFDKEVVIRANDLAPMVTWGTTPEQAAPVTGVVPDVSQFPDPARRSDFLSALAYMDLEPGQLVEQIQVDRVFIGSCTNSRIEDLRSAARVLKGRKAVVPGIVVPGSGLVKAQAEAEGLDRIFQQAGLEWRHAGCSMCVGMNGDIGQPGERCASTSNRNFAGRQGKGVKTHLVSPAMAAAAAATGRFADVRKLMAH